jgi:hypothetical protein
MKSKIKLHVPFPSFYFLSPIPFYHVIVYSKTSWKKSNSNFPSKNRIQNPFNVYPNLPLTLAPPISDFLLKIFQNIK